MQQPNMRWMTVDLAEYRKQQQRESAHTARQQRRLMSHSLLARPSMHARWVCLHIKRSVAATDTGKLAADLPVMTVSHAAHACSISVVEEGA